VSAGPAIWAGIIGAGWIGQRHAQTLACRDDVAVSAACDVDTGRDGIICNAVAPGQIRTGAPGDVAAAVTFLASDQASYISGVNLMVDGGWMAY
jgi:predicted dehydrogenase